MDVPYKGKLVYSSCCFLTTYGVEDEPSDSMQNVETLLDRKWGFTF